MNHFALVICLSVERKLLLLGARWGSTSTTTTTKQNVDPAAKIAARIFEQFRAKILKSVYLLC
jgi:hypothetical protein